MYVSRLAENKLKKLVNTFPAVVITGARQVGKSTLLQHVFSQADCVVFDPVVDVENARQDPELFLQNHLDRPLLLDEIQYAPELVPTIKRQIDKDRKPGQFILTGSQQWSVLKSISESLAGRTVFLDLESFCLSELTQTSIAQLWLKGWLENPVDFIDLQPGRMQSSKTLYEILWRGFLPEAQFLPLESLYEFQTAYLRTCIERDVRYLGEVSNWQQFGRFVRLVAALTAQEINYSQLGRELGLNPQTSKRWLDMLVATFQWYEVPAYSGNTTKRVASKPKGYIADTGIACSAQAIFSPQAIPSHPLWGALFETAVVAEIRKQCSIMSPKPIMYHWRTHRQAEVDIILERDGIFYPIIIKAKSGPTRQDTSGITAFRKTYPKLNIEKGLVIAPTEKIIQLSENDYALPWDICIEKLKRQADNTFCFH